MGWWNRKSKRLAEALNDNAHLTEALEDARLQLQHVRKLLKMKDEECEALRGRCAHMQQRVEYADAVETEIADIESQVERFAEVKEKLDGRIVRLKKERAKLIMERDEARSMLAARENIPDSISPISFNTDAVDMSPLSYEKRKSDRKKGYRTTTPVIDDVPNTDDSSSETSDDIDWYQPLDLPPL